MAKCNFRGLTDKLLDLIFPPRCPGCSELISVKATDGFCPECRLKWEQHTKENCRRCGQPLDNCWCGVPNDKEGYITHEYHLVQYDKTADTVIKRLIYNIKNHKSDIAFRTVAREMYNNLYSRVDYNNLILCYVPRSKTNIRKYGHDQSSEITKVLSEMTGLEVADVIIHTGKSVQKKLGQSDRTKNAEMSYHIINGAGKLIKDKNVILIDDVLTTGATVSRCAHLLKWKGAKRVIVFTIAKTI